MFTLSDDRFCAGGYDSEISDSGDERSDSEDAGAANSSADEHEVMRRRDEFRRKQRDVLKQVEREEKQAMGMCAWCCQT